MSKMQKLDEGFKTEPSSDGNGTTITLKGAGVGIGQIILFSVLA